MPPSPPANPASMPFLRRHRQRHRSPSSSSSSSSSSDFIGGDAKLLQMPEQVREQLLLLTSELPATLSGDSGYGSGADVVDPLLEPKHLSALPTMDEIQMCFAQMGLMMTLLAGQGAKLRRHGHHNPKAQTQAQARPQARPRSTPPRVPESIPSEPVSCFGRPRSSAAASPSRLIPCFQRPRSSAAALRSHQPKSRGMASSSSSPSSSSSCSSESESGDSSRGSEEGEQERECPIRKGSGGRRGLGGAEPKEEEEEVRELLVEMAATRRSIAAAEAEVQELAKKGEEDAMPEEEAFAEKHDKRRSRIGSHGGASSARGVSGSSSSAGVRGNANASPSAHGDPTKRPSETKHKKNALPDTSRSTNLNGRTVQMPVWTPSGSAAMSRPPRYGTRCSFRSEEEFEIIRSPGK